jgi:vacuolar-type H+-ATPase subunit I/STV1
MNRDLPIDMIEDTSTALIPASERAALALQSNKTEQHLLALATKHAGITLVVDKAGREQAHGAAMELTRARTAVVNAAKEARDDATKFSKAVIAEEKRLIAIVEPEEIRLKAVRDTWDTEQARIKREAEERERARVLAITGRISEIKGFYALTTQCRTAERVKTLIDKLAAYDLSGFDEFDAEAAQAHADTTKAMVDHFAALAEREAEAARVKAEREELARQQAEAKRQADAMAAQQKAEADRLAAERAEFARQQQEATDKMAAQQAEIERQRAELESAKTPEPEYVPAPEVFTGTDLVDTAVNPLPSTLTREQQVKAILSDPPSAQELIADCAHLYMVDPATAARWLAARADEFKAIAIYRGAL